MVIHKKIYNWFDVYEEEIGLFIWTAVLLFLVRSSGILLNNYAETTFLKRYGVEYMPIVNMVNAVVTMFVMGILAGFMTRFSGVLLLSRLFIFCGLSVAGIRAVIPLGIDLIYPILFMLKSQYEVLLALLFWNLANDLFNTRQSKRLFPLITAGGVIGQILGSFATPFVARWLHLDNLLSIYVGTALAGAWAVQAMGKRYPTLLFKHKEESEKKKRTSVIDEFKTVIPLLKSSILFKLLVVLTFMPNVVITILNYQFNFAVNEQFATESGLIEFFGYFRGVLNIISLVILLFIGKLYNRFGLPVALMFHPFNYILVFLTLLLRFDALSAMYARMSSNIIRTTINLPATAVVTGLFPENFRAMVRPFLRGTVVRIGLFLGSGLILLSDNLFHPRYLSLVALPFVLVWVVTPFILKRNYTNILLGLVSDKQKDFRSMDADELSQILRDKQVQKTLLRRFMDESGENRLWYGRLLQSIDFPNLDQHIVVVLKNEQDVDMRIGLIELLSDQAGPLVVELFGAWLEKADQELIVAMIGAGRRMSPELFAPMNRKVVESTQSNIVRAHATGSLYSVEPETFGPIIENWVTSENSDSCCAGIIAAGISGDNRFEDHLKFMLNNDDDAILLEVMGSLDTIHATGLNELVLPHLHNSNPGMRQAALTLFCIEDEKALKKVISMLGDKSKEVATLAKEKIRSAPYENSLRLVKSLSLPKKMVRESLFDLLSEMSIKGWDVFRFVQLQARTCYKLTIQAHMVARFPGGELQRLLTTHLEERIWFTLQTTLRVLVAQDASGRMQTIFNGVFSSDRRKRANSLEAMDDILDKGIVRLLTPLFDDISIDERIAAGQRLFPDELNIPDDLELIDSLLNSPNWVTLVLMLTILPQMMEPTEVIQRLRFFLGHKSPDVASTAKRLEAQLSEGNIEQEAAMEKETTITLTDKILYLRNIEIFAGLTISELAAVASASEEVVFNQEETVFNEGERGDTLFLIVQGDVSVIKDRIGRKAIELDRIGAGDYFGEMALFGDDSRSATIRVKKTARFLTLQKEDLQEIVREFPQIALNVCSVFSMRIRHLHRKISEQSC